MKKLSSALVSKKVLKSNNEKTKQQLTKINELSEI